jgi:aconitate hydratase 2/2-methylisocitrate dehydratase
VLDNDGNPVLEQAYSVDTGTVLTDQHQDQEALRRDGGEGAGRHRRSFTPQKMEFMKAGGSYADRLRQEAADLRLRDPRHAAKSGRFAPSKEISHEGQGLTAVEKIFNANARRATPGKVLHAGSDVRVKVNIVGSQDTTGLMTSQELEAMAATVISPTVDGAYQSGCHTASVWD